MSDDVGSNTVSCGSRLTVRGQADERILPVAMSLAALVDLDQEEGRSTVDLFSPRVRLRSVNISDLDAAWIGSSS